MSDFAGSIWWLLVALGVLVTCHEFGHFIVARLCGVRVLRFSIGFGKPIWSRIDKHGTEFAIAPIPLGGYVRMHGEGPFVDQHEAGESEGVDTPAAAHADRDSFAAKSVWQRMAIVFAGPAMNFVLCVLFLWAMLVVGKADWSATLGDVSGIARQAGFARGERITAIDGRAVATATDAMMALQTAALDRRDVGVQVRDAYGNPRRHVLPLSKVPAATAEEDLIDATGLGWFFDSVPATVGQVQADGPAANRLQPGDTILAIDGTAVRDLAELRATLQKLGPQGGAVALAIDRHGERLELSLVPQQLVLPDGGKYWGLGISAAQSAMPAYDAKQQLGVLAAVPAAFRETAQLTADSLGMIKRMLSGEASSRNVSGPITIARAANATAKRGAGWYLWFLAAVSLSLGLVNLLPIPVLDGGHLLYYLIELVKGRPLSERSMIAGQYVGLALLAGLMGLAFYNDLFRPLS